MINQFKYIPTQIGITFLTILIQSNHWWFRIRQNYIALLNLIKHQQPDIDKIYSYVKDPFKSKHQLFINSRKKVGIKKFKTPKAVIDYSQTIDDVYENRHHQLLGLIIQ